MPKIVDHAKRRDEIALVACQVVASHGFEQATVARIARAAGYTTGMVAHYYESKQDIILAVGTELEAFGRQGAQDDDAEVAKVYAKAGAKVSALDAATVGKWRDIARDTAWKDYGAKTATSATLLKLANDAAA